MSMAVRGKAEIEHSRINAPPVPAAFSEPWSARKILRMLRLVGPAAIVASVSVGAGETIVAVRAGAWTGYELLWLILLSVVVKGIFVTYLLGRYTAICGEPIGQRLAKLPGPRGWLLMLLVALELIAAPPLWAAIARPSGELLCHMIFGTNADPAVARALSTLFMASALSLSLVFTYDRVERQQLIVCGILLTGTILGTLLVRPNVKEVLLGALAIGSASNRPEAIPEEFQSNWMQLLSITFGYVGGTVMTYLIYADWITLRRWGMTGHSDIDEIRRRAALGTPGDYMPTDPAVVSNIRRSIAPLRWDVAFGAAVLLVVAGSFLIAGAAVLHPRIIAGEITGAFQGWGLLTDQAWVWRSIHPALAWMYYICVLAALWGTLVTYPQIYARGIAEYRCTIFPLSPWRQIVVQKCVCCYVVVTTSALIWANVGFDLLTLVVAFLATNLAVTIAMLAALYLNFTLPRAYRTRAWILAGGVLSAIVLVAASIFAGIGVWREVRIAISLG